MTTERLYLEDAYLRGLAAQVTASADGWSALSRSALHPGRGGQPFDQGSLAWSGQVLAVTGVREDEDRRVWHQIGVDVPVGDSIQGALDWPRRFPLMRYHCLLHVVNAVAHQRFGGLVSGAEIAPERSRVDLSVTVFSRDDVPAFEAEVNAVIRRELRVHASVVPEAELALRPELVRT